MSLTLDIADDFVDLADNTEAATVILRRPDGDVSVSITNALRGPAKYDAQNLDGLFVGGQAAMQPWGIPDTELNPGGNGREILENDEIVVPSRPQVVYVVKSAERRTLGSSVGHWFCVCQERRV